jgi:SAM-dependent methyltransferase
VFRLGVGPGLGGTVATALLLEHAEPQKASASSSPESLIKTVNDSAVARLRRILELVFNPDEEVWERFLAATRDQPAWPRLVRATAMFAAPGDALDIGAGAGRDSAYLLEAGWHVTAVDSSPAAVDLLRRLAPEDRLRVVRAAAQDFEPGTYDLVNAQFSLPFVPPPRFDATVRRLQQSVRAGGVMAVTFFGLRDEWNVAGSRLTFTTEDEVRRRFAGWGILELTEIDEDGTTATGGHKHWDVIHVIARK